MLAPQLAVSEWAREDGRVPRRPKTRTALALLATFDRWLRQARRELVKEDLVLLDELLEIEKSRSRLRERPDDDPVQTMAVSFLLPWLDFMRRDAARALNRAVAGGIPRTPAARRNLARHLRMGCLGCAEQSIRDTVRFMFPVRRQVVRDYVRDGKTIKGYGRAYGDPAQWPLPPALLSENAREIYPYVLAAPMPKASNWHKRR